MFKILSWLFLSKEARELSDEFKRGGVTEARVSSRGTISMPAKCVINSPEYNQLVSELRLLGRIEGHNDC